MGDHRDDQLGLGAAEVPGGVPPRPALTVPGRADGRHFPEPLGRAVAAQRRHRGEDDEQRRFGDFTTKEERYARTDEFLEIVRLLWSGETINYRGEHLSVEDATLRQLPNPVPQIYFGGSSAPAIQVAAKRADVYLTWGEPPEQVAEKIDRVRAVAAEVGRTLRFGVRLHTIARDSSAAAWAEAHRLLDSISDERIAQNQAAMKRSASEGSVACWR